MVEKLRSCRNGTKVEKFKNIFLRCISSTFGKTLVIHLKDLVCLNKETFTNDFQFSVPFEILTTGYNAEEPVSHHNVSHSDAKSITLPGIKMNEFHLILIKNSASF